MRTELRRRTPVSSLERQIQKELEGIPQQHFQIWGTTIGGYERHQIHFLLLPEYCEQGVLVPTPQGYAYNIQERIECPNIYCNRYMDAMETRAGHAEAEVSPYEGDYVPGLPHPGGNPIQFGDIAPFDIDDPHYVQPLELYNIMGSGLEYTVLEHTYQSVVPQYSMDTTSNSTNRPDLPNTPWNSDIYDPVRPYGHR